MLPAEIKLKVQAAYSQAIANRSLQRSRSSSFPFQFRELKLYGREAGIDFVETHLDLIVREAAETAACKLTSLDVPLYGFGKAAIEGGRGPVARLDQLEG